MKNTAQRLHTIRAQFAKLQGAERAAADLGRAEWPSDVTSNPGELAHAYDIGRALVLAAKRALGLTGIRCKVDAWADCCETIQLDPRGLCQRAFITCRDV